MNDIFENQLSRAEKVNEFLAAHISELEATPALRATLKPQLQTAIEQTQADDNRATEDTTGYHDNKEALATQLDDAAFHVSTGLVSYGDDHDDFVIMNMFDFAYSALQSFRDTRRAQFAKAVFDKASEAPIKEELISHNNVSDADITLVNTLLASYNNIIAAPREHIGEKSAYNKQVGRDISNIKKILNRIALKMATYRATSRTLFEAFEEANKIDDTGAHHTGFNGTVNAGETKKITDIVYDAEATAGIKNLGTISLDFVMYNAGAAAGSVTVSAGAVLNTTMGAIAANGDALYVKNTGVIAGKYSVSI